jgi:UDP-sulfoquinovose synthase
MLSDPAPGEFRVFNQITEWFSVNDFAERVQRVGNSMGLDVQINSVPNPRVEKEEHYYEVVHTKLLDLGLEPHLLDDAEVERMIGLALQHRDRIDPAMIVPTVSWRATESPVAPTTLEKA